MIVVDASAVLSGLLRAGAARDLLAAEQLHAPHLVDVEVVSGLRRVAAAGTVTVPQATAAVGVLGRLGLSRHPLREHLDRVWQLRENVSAYDAAYVALAEALGCALVTADTRLARAPGLRCPVVPVLR